ncbi:hypothetical protein LDENG_00062230 [Lucifuga dentata]|nr:hypothetical protein LDENG_00062230 [Lucifuga dentata]
MEQKSSSRSKRSFSISSLRVRSERQNSYEADGFPRRRGLRPFSSLRGMQQKKDTDVVPNEVCTSHIHRLDHKTQTAAMNAEVTRRIKTKSGLTERRSRRSAQPKIELISEADGRQSSSGEDAGGGRGALKRISAVWASFRRVKKDRGKEPDPVEPPGAAVAEKTSRQQRYVSGQYFFEYLVVVSLKKSKDRGNYEPQITYQFPKRDGMARFQKEEEEKTLKAITLFCFPEGISWAPLTEYHSETFSFVLTEIDGSRRNGYCRRLLPGGNGARPPEAYCIISRLACFGLFSKVRDQTDLVNKSVNL